jgi:hypothetical protein
MGICWVKAIVDASDAQWKFPRPHNATNLMDGKLECVDGRDVRWVMGVIADRLEWIIEFQSFWDQNIHEIWEKSWWSTVR